MGISSYCNLKRYIAGIVNGQFKKVNFGQQINALVGFVRDA